MEFRGSGCCDGWGENKKYPIGPDGNISVISENISENYDVLGRPGDTIQADASRPLIEANF